MSTRKIYNWQCRDCTVVLGRRTLVMGILNATPDSFSDGGDYSDPSAAVDRALEMVAQGADIIDVGGESTRPGADPVSVNEEIRRVVPVIKKIREQSDILVSIDTMKAETAARALEAGADIINDISALEADPRMVDVAAETQAGVVLMHMKGSPQTMQNNPGYENVAQEVGAYLAERMRFAEQHGVRRECMVVDPGVGFGKTVEHNLELLRGLPQLAECGRPILIGTSRKSFIGKILNRENPVERLAGSLGAAAWAVMHGAHILRVHDAIDTCDVCGLVDTLLAGERPCS
ncbi:MAG: dihydropteroate synthase [Verrucomicrobiota bacterium]